MEQLFNFDLKEINNTSSKDLFERKKNLELFFKTSHTNKKDENWKFTDLNSIINKNFQNITNSINFIDN